MSKFQKFKQSQIFGLLLLIFIAFVFWAIFKTLAPQTFGDFNRLKTYLKTALIYAVGGCGLYFICVMGPFDMSVGANIVLSSVLAVNMSNRFGYAGLLIAPMISGVLVGLLNGLVYIKLRISSLIVTADYHLFMRRFPFLRPMRKTSYWDRATEPSVIILGILYWLLPHFSFADLSLSTPR